MFYASHLRCEYLQGQVVTDEEQPYLFWRLESSGHDQKQAAYRVLVSSSREQCEHDLGDVWDSGRVISPEHTHIRYQGQPLVSGGQYWWKVKVWDCEEREGESDFLGTWSMGLLHPADWQGQWIGGSAPVPYLRRRFFIDRAIRRMMLYVTALGFYELSINGQRVGEDYFTPGWTHYPRQLYYQAYDLTGQVQSGENVLGAILAPGWLAQVAESCAERPPHIKPALLVQGNLEYQDGSTAFIVTDSLWQTHAGPIRLSELGKGELYDARRQMTDWNCPGFAAHDWQSAELRPTVQATLRMHPAHPIHLICEVSPRQITQPAPGRYRLDFGDTIVGQVKLHLDSWRGERIELHYANTPSGTGQTSATPAKDRYDHHDGGDVFWHPHFSFHRFRYVEIHNNSPDTLPAISTRPVAEIATGLILHSDLRSSGDFACSDAQVNRLIENLAQAIRTNLLDIPLNALRESWTGAGELSLSMRSMPYFVDATTFLKKWFADLESTENRDISSTGATPADRVFNPWAADGYSAVVGPSVLYDFYGDRRLLDRQSGWMCRTVDQLARRYAAGGCAPFRLGAELASEDETPLELIEQAYLANSADLAARAMHTLGRSADAEHYESLFESMRTAFFRKYGLEDGRLSCPTLSACLLALAFDLLPAELRSGTVAQLLEMIAQPDFQMPQMPISAHWLLPILSRFGHVGLAYRLFLLESSRETFNLAAFGSFSEWVFGTIAGLRPLTPGFRLIGLAPVPGGNLQWARTSFKSVRGVIRSEWRTENQNFYLDVDLPAATVAQVTLPGPHGVCLDTTQLPFAAGQSYTQFEIGSGTYRFACRLRDQDYQSWYVAENLPQALDHLNQLQTTRG